MAAFRRAPKKTVKRFQPKVVAGSKFTADKNNADRLYAAYSEFQRSLENEWTDTFGRNQIFALIQYAEFHLNSKTICVNYVEGSSVLPIVCQRFDNHSGF